MSETKDDSAAARVQEQRLLERARLGGPEAIQKLFELYRPRVRGLLARWAPREEIDDLVQETIIAGAAGFSRFQGKSTFFTWLSGIARNLANHNIRGAARRSTSISLNAPESEGVVQQISHSTPLQQQVAQRMTSDVIFAAIEQNCTLPQQRVLLLAFQGEALDSIGTLLQMSASTTRSHYRRGRCRLLAYMLQNHADLFGGQTAIHTAWAQACQEAEEARRPNAQEQAAWNSRNAQARDYCGAVLKLARYLHLVALPLGIWLGVQR